MTAHKHDQVEQPHARGQGWRPGGATLRPRSWAGGATPCPRYEAAAVLCWSSHEAIPHIQGKRKPSKTVGTERGHQRADRLKPDHRQLANLITRTTALSNSMKLSHAVWGHPRWMGQGGEV